MPIIDTEVLGLINKSVVWNHPHYNLRYKGVDITMDDPNPAPHSIVNITYEGGGNRRGEKDKVNVDDIEGNKGDIYLETDMVMIVCPRDYETSKLYGRFPDPVKRANIKNGNGSYWRTAYSKDTFQRQYWNPGMSLFIALPKVPEAVLPDKEEGKEDRFAKVQWVLDTDGERTESYDMYASKGRIPVEKFEELRKVWNIPKDVVGN